MVEAASDHIRALTLHIRLVNQQLKPAHRKLHELYAQLIPSEEDEPGQQCGQRDVVILRSMPGLGRRLSRLAQPVRGGPGDPPQRQNLRRRAPLCLQ